MAEQDRNVVQGVPPVTAETNMTQVAFEAKPPVVPAHVDRDPNKARPSGGHLFGTFSD